MDNQFNNKTVLSLDRTDIVPLLLWALIVFLTWLFMHGADHFLALTPAALGKYFELRWVLIAHITAGGGALIMGLIQFWPKLRKYSWKLHRIVGFLYLAAILLSSLCAVILAFSTAYEVNWAYAFSLQIWVGVWISSTAIAYYAALTRKFQLHQEWMVRSYLVTLAFILSGLAVKLPVIQSLGSFAEISPSLFWMGWSVPLYIYQIILSGRAKK
ncbi:DUF2306 domain-containing protein [Dyadobacter psychrophilus]|uniref:Predicted membrane protein n=1 Tax=Dyadobacter psychrophilus TaxID=651661 RepID=A0A1T5BZU9_9BACT|nr:DUF2306 domain-containing protein [Dyadobacter psychrophilus]SKB52697.1 Predicted membrane protein [Dyadobacter psychrophilus]